MSIKIEILNTLEEFSKIKHNLNKKILNEISNNTSLNSIIKSGVDLAHSLAEGGRTLEKNIILNLRNSAISDQVDSEIPIKDEKENVRKPADPQVGTIVIRTSLKENNISVPINVSNYDQELQEVSIKAPFFKNMETGKQAISKIKIEQSHLLLKPNSTERVIINFEMGSNLRPGNKYFTSIQLSGKEERNIQVILEVVAETENLVKPEIKFNPSVG